MKTIKHVIVMLLILLLCMPLANAQPLSDKKQEAQTTSKIAQGVLIIIQQEQVRFTAQKAVEEMRLQIFDQGGQLVYDSGAVTGTELTWVLRQAGGEAVKSGLYAYTLSVKEAGAAEPRLRRGHFIVDRAKERDGQTDRLWVTSQGESGVGTELTVARNEDVTIAGAAPPSERQTIKAGENAQTGENESKTVSEKTASDAALAIASGTVNRIAKFISATDLGDSGITETSDSKVGLGTTSPVGKLQVVTANDTNPSFVTAWDARHFVIGGAASNGGVGLSYDQTKQVGYITALSPNVAWRNLVLQSGGGNVGIGTSTPAARFHIVNGDMLAGAPGQEWIFHTRSQASSDFLHITDSENGAFQFQRGLILRKSGNVGIGNTNPQAKLHIANGDILAGAPGQEWIFHTRSHAGGDFLHITDTENGVFQFQRGLVLTQAGNVGIGTTAPQARLDVVGQTRTQSLQITGGADFAENFDVNVATTGSEAMEPKVEAGMVVSIDPANPGKLSLSTQAYDRRVAGVVSGAGGVKPGMVMSQESTLADGKHPVALSGRVYCWVDASQGAIEPGDLLTTSSAPGHAMKAADSAKAQGAIIGKAMTGLKEGRGLVLVLVTLQ